MSEARKLGGLYGNHQAGSVWDKECICPSIDTMQGGLRQPMIIEEVVKTKNIVATDNLKNHQNGG